LTRYRQRFGFRLYHYCLLSSHFHLLLHVDDPRRLLALMAGLVLAYVRYVQRRHRCVGHVWQGRFKSPLVQRESYWLSCGRYIARNPLEPGMVAEPWSYPWSSWRYYALGEADALVTESPCYTERSPDPEQLQQLWRRFLMEADPREEVVRRGDWVVADESSGRSPNRQGRQEPNHCRHPAPGPPGHPE
jgi:putative transposase